MKVVYSCGHWVQRSNSPKASYFYRTEDMSKFSSKFVLIFCQRVDFYFFQLNCTELKLFLFSQSVSTPPGGSKGGATCKKTCLSSRLSSCWFLFCQRDDTELKLFLSRGAIYMPPTDCADWHRNLSHGVILPHTKSTLSLQQIATQSHKSRNLE